ncbi:uncharacterized protein LOC136033961 [Artemia franciscana]|uniref:Uncharacterized protein n=1 Tax=Artemia franciscana TaxID=6661 RepID=A0AA88LIM0_ARTSF|nr:hypothetical protein QYM36_001742 [Artemia franciscana]
MDMKSLIDWHLAFHIGDTILLFFVYLCQVGLLNYYILKYSDGELALYFWFLGDFVIFVAFALAMFWSYKYLKNKRRKKKNQEMLERLKNRANNENGQPHDVISLSSVSESMGEDPLSLKVKRPGALRDQKKASHSSLVPSKKYTGALPMVYTSWLLYSIILVTKVAVMFKAEIPNIIQPTDVFGPQLLKVSIASSSVIFILLVAGHHDANINTFRSQFILNLCKSVAFEIMDSVDFLTILILSLSRITLPFWFENTVLGFACINFILPTVALYNLSLSDFAKEEQSLPVTSLYKLLHLVLVNIPYFCIRVYLWDGYGSDISMFTIKNAISILLALRSLWSDLIILWNVFLVVVLPRANKVGDSNGTQLELLPKP